MADKKTSRIRRATKSRSKIRRQEKTRLSVHRTPRHIYAQVVESDGSRVLASASSIDKDLKSTIGNGGNVEAAKAVGKRIAEKAKDAGISAVAFDRSGFRYHGRVKALAEAARESGLEF